MLIYILSFFITNSYGNDLSSCPIFPHPSERFDCGQGIYKNEVDDLDGVIEVQHKLINIGQSGQGTMYHQFVFRTTAQKTQFAFSSVDMPQYGYQFFIPATNQTIIKSPSEERLWMRDASDLQIFLIQGQYSFVFNNNYQGQIWEWLEMNANAHIPIQPEYSGFCSEDSLLFKMRGAANLGGRLPTDPDYDPGLNEAVKSVLQLSKNEQGNLIFHLRYYTRYAGHPSSPLLQKIQGVVTSKLVNIFRGVDLVCKKI